MIEPQIKSRFISSGSLKLSALVALVSIGILFGTPVVLPAQGIGKASVQLIDGTSLECNIESIDEQGRVAGQGIPEGFNIGELLSLKSERSVSKSASEVTIYPVGGGEIFAGKLTLADETMTCQSSADGGELQLPLESIRGVVWTSSEGVQSAIKSPSKDNDQVVVQVADGERIVGGILESVDGEFLHVNFKNESRKIGLAKVMAFVVADGGLKKETGSIATVELVDGSRIVGVISGLADGDLGMNLAGGASLKIKAQKIAGMSIVSDRLAYLSDIEPTDVEEKSLFAIQLPWQRDRSVGNNPIRLMIHEPRQKIELRKGIGTQSFSKLSFANTNEFDRFRAVVGIDAETGGRGDCQMVVQGDGIELWSKRVKAAEDPIQVDLDIAGIKEIALIVNPGEDFDLGDHADWGDARFLKTK